MRDTVSSFHSALSLRHDFEDDLDSSRVYQRVQHKDCDISFKPDQRVDSEIDRISLIN
jgi:hypothetical protein